MSFNLGLLPFELKSLRFDGLRSKDMNSLLTKTYSRVGKFSWNHFVRVLNNEAREVVISSDVMTGCLEAQVVVNRRLDEPSPKLDAVRTLLIDNYDSYTYNIYQELSVVNGLPPIVVRNDELRWEDIFHYLYVENAFDNIVISPGPGTPTCQADIGICLRILLDCGDVPILGICLGHQALGYAHGGEVIHAAEPVHGRLSEIKHTGCRLFNNIPSGQSSGFKVVRYHSLVIDPHSLPEELIPIAWTSSTDSLSFLSSQASTAMSGVCKNQLSNSSSRKSTNKNSWPSHGSEMRQSGEVLMGIKHSTRPHYGLQFHPESVATCFGRQIFKNFRKITEDFWLQAKLSSNGEKKLHRRGASSKPAAQRYV